MRELGAVTRALLEITRDGGDERALAEGICRACVEGLDVDGAAVSLLTGTVSRETLWVSDATAELLEELQFTLNEGVCMEAAATGCPVLVPDLRAGAEVARWPIFAVAVAEQTEVAALFALPLQGGTVNLGVLDLYRSVPGGVVGPFARSPRGDPPGHRHDTGPARGQRTGSIGPDACLCLR